MTGQLIPADAVWGGRVERPDVPDALVEWVEWLVTTYRLGDTLRPCWAWHPDVVEELQGLWLHRLAADKAATAPTDGGDDEDDSDDPLAVLGLRATAALTAWHDTLDRVRERVRRSMEVCRSDQHEAIRPVAWRTWLG